MSFVRLDGRAIELHRVSKHNSRQDNAGTGLAWHGPVTYRQCAMSEAPDTARFRLIAVFDTNAYIGTGRKQLDTIVQHEANAGVLALASVWPCLELVSRCASPDPAVCRRARSALERVLVHAGYATPTGARLRVHEAGEFTLARGLFGCTPQEPLLELGFVSDLAVAAATKPLELFGKEHASDLLAVVDRVRREEEQFTAFAAMSIASAGSLRRSDAPSNLDLAIIAAGLVQVLADQYNVELKPENSRRGVNLVVHNFSVALAFLHGIITDLSASAGVPGRANSTWDLKIAFHAARGASISGIPVLLVSDDRRLLRAARDAQEIIRVAPLAEYLSLLSQPAAVAERAAALRAIS